MSAPFLNASLPDRADRLRTTFQTAQPFRHVVIDGFFDDAAAQALLSEFPPFDHARARNEFGMPTGKWTVPDMETIGPTFARLKAYLLSRPFLEQMERISGIPDLLPDPHFYGGGTHDNLHGQDLDPHVDFNYDITRRLHRRLNVIVYMNPEWEDGWGGGLELHSDPRDPARNHVRIVAPAFNRCVMFETNERSWHGFERISLPEGRRHLSRRSISIYLYTRCRPAAEIAPEHGTFYVQRPLPAHLRPGHTLTTEDVATLEEAIRRRDHWIFHYQRQELARGRVPLGVQAEEGPPAPGLGGWLRHHFPFRRTLRPLVHWAVRVRDAALMR